MPVTSQQIITAVEKSHPQTHNRITIKNSSDLDIEERVQQRYQYLIGLAHRDPVQAGCERYQYAMKKQLGEFGLDCAFSVWSFEDYELDDTITAVKELSEHFDANLDIERMVRKMNFGQPKGEMYFIVVTIVIIPFISIAQEGN